MSYEKIGTTAPNRASWSHEPLRNLVFKLKNEHPDLDDKDLFVVFSKQVKKEPDALESALEQAFTNAMRSLRAGLTENDLKASRDRTAALTAQIGSAIDAHIQQEVTEHLMKIIMPNGKRAENCNGSELMTAGGGWIKVGARVGPKRTLGKCMTEEELRQMIQI